MSTSVGTASNHDWVESVFNAFDSHGGIAAIMGASGLGLKFSERFQI